MGGIRPAQADAETPTPTATPGPNRKKVLTVDFTRNNWWISNWRTNEVLCALSIEHEGLPDPAEVKTWCDTSAYNQYLNTRPCPQASNGGDIQLCTGVYLHFLGSKPAQRKVTIDLPPAVAWISLTGCEPIPPTNRCGTRPSLLITGEEPLPNETIISVQGTFGGETFSCMGSSCVVPIPATGMQGENIEFWVNSSFGNSSKHYSAKVRMVPWGDFVAPDGKNNDPRLWYVDVLSTQWRGAPSASCSQIWESFPDLGGPPAWLSTPNRLEDLLTNEPFYYLAGSLIQNGQVDARDCPNGGLQSEGVANACGLERARPAVVDWQNQFDAQIVQVGQETGIPAQLMKNMFNRESQFWPGIFRTYMEAGLGQLTEKGADTVLLWNPSFYDQFCPLIFEKSVCQTNFTDLGEKEQNLLRGALVNKVNAACPDCPAGIDLTQATFSVNVFASSLLANCEQAGQVVYNATGKASGLSSSYIDLWKFTLVNYNAGSGCLEEAVQQTIQEGLTLTWENVSNRLDPALPGVDPVR